MAPDAASPGLRLAGPPEFTTTCVLPALTDLVRSGLRLQVSLGRPAERLLAGLQDGDHDLVISTAPPDVAVLTVTDLFREEFLLVAAPAVASMVTGSDSQALEGLPLISYSQERPLIRRYWRQVFGEEPPMAAAAVVPDLRGVLSLTVAGAGFTVLPRYLCRRELASGALISLMEPAAPPTNTIFLATQGPVNDTIAGACRALLASSPSW
ncbi:MAG: substrate-binding domain-containing protein [Actinomycetota bacterium]